MPDEPNGKNGNTGTPPADTSPEKAYTKEEFDAALQRETDRRLTKAQTKWAEDLKTAFGTSDIEQAKKHVETISGQAKQAEIRAAFAERATTAGIVDLKAAWAVAKEYGLISEKGDVDLKKLESDHPSLFGPKPRSVGGAPTGDPPQKRNMTALLRKAATGV